MPSALAAPNKHQRNRASGAIRADKPNAAARNGDRKILGNASIAQALVLCGANTVTATTTRLVLATASPAMEQASQKVRLCLRKTNAIPVGMMETMPKTAMKKRLSPNANIPADASLSGPLVWLM